MGVQASGPPGSAPSLLVWTKGSDRSLQPGPSYLIGRDPDCCFAASGRELRRFNEIALGFVFLTVALICQFTNITNIDVSR